MEYASEKELFSRDHDSVWNFLKVYGAAFFFCRNIFIVWLLLLFCMFWRGPITLVLMMERVDLTILNT